MIMGIASLVFIPLLAISLVHLMWAFGSTYPVKSEKALAQTVAGFKGIEKMPPRLASFAVSAGALFAGIWALSMADPAPSSILTTGGIILSLVFLARGVFGYTKKWQALTPEEPFRAMDKKIYSPLCIFIGVGFLTLILWRVL